MPTDPAAVVTRWFEEFWNQGNEAVAHELLAPDGIFYGFPTPTEHVDSAGFVAAGRQFRSAFSNIHVTLEDILVEPGPGYDKVAARWTTTLTHSGDGLGFPATGRQVTLPGISITYVRDGRLLTGWNSLDLTQPVAHLRALAERATP